MQLEGGPYSLLSCFAPKLNNWAKICLTLSTCISLISKPDTNRDRHPQHLVQRLEVWATHAIYSTWSGLGHHEEPVFLCDQHSATVRITNNYSTAGVTFPIMPFLRYNENFFWDNVSYQHTYQHIRITHFRWIVLSTAWLSGLFKKTYGQELAQIGGKLAQTGSRSSPFLPFSGYIMINTCICAHFLIKAVSLPVCTLYSQHPNKKSITTDLSHGCGNTVQSASK